MTFVASEFVLFGFEDTEGKTAKPDVLMYKDGILYGIEFKNSRNGPSEKEGIRYSEISQAEAYVAHMKESGRFEQYVNCFRAFPNAEIGTITEIRGIDAVPAPPRRSRGSLEKDVKKAGVGLWEFGADGLIQRM